MSDVCGIIAVAGRSARSLSETELLRQHPVLLAGFSGLFVLGLVADVWLLFQLARMDGRPVLQVPPKGWSLHDLVAVTGVLLLTMLTGLGLLALVVRKHSAPWLLAGDCVLRVGFLAGLLVYLRRRQADLSWHLSRDGRELAHGAVAFVAVLPPLAFVGGALGKIYDWLHIAPTPQPVTLMFVESKSAAELGLLLVLALVIAPVFEETFFRGFAYPALKQRLGAGPALVLVSAVFAAIHFHAASALPLFVLAIGLTLAYEFTGSLVAPVTMHVLFNAANVVMLLYARFHP